MFQEIITKKLKKTVPEAKNYSVSFAPEEFGDYSTNLALILAKETKTSPIEVGEEIVDKLKKDKNLKKIFFKIELIKPGFINFHLGPAAFSERLEVILKEAESFGRTNLGQGEKINIEFVSANPTGPLTLGNGRSAAHGESLARLLEFLGFKVTKEYFLNDIGRQVKILGESVARRYLELEGKLMDYPEEMYQGEYIRDIAKDLKKEGLYHGFLDDFESLAETARQYAIEKMTKAIKDSLGRFGVRHDVWFKESELSQTGEIKKLLDDFSMKQLSYEKDGALWFKSSAYGLDQDVVIRKSNGFTTYLLSDLAYAQNKLKRGFAKMIYVLGADHYGDVHRIKAGLRAMGLPEEQFEFLVHQLVTLRENGEAVRLSKRAGRIVTLDDLLREVPVDVVKFFFLAKSLGSHIDFDLVLAKEESNKNPVYYIQYAYVRMLGIMRKAAEQKLRPSKKVAKNKKWEKEEANLVRKLLKFPEELATAGRERQVHTLTNYALELAGLVNRFYENHAVVGADKKTAQDRLTLVQASVIVLSNTLNILGLSLPERM